MALRGNSKLKVGSRLVEQGKVFRVFRIETRGNGAGEQRILHYKPLFNTGPDAQIICTIPEEKLDDASIRPPVKKNFIKEILVSLTTWKHSKDEYETEDAKDILKENDLVKTAGILKAFWKEKYNSEETITKGKRDILEIAVERMREEIAYVTNTTLEKAEKKIMSALR